MSLKKELEVQKVSVTSLDERILLHYTQDLSLFKYEPFIKITLK